ncbi:MAG: hypothetical protein QOH21_2013 [Acidobacteriota bacterium]|nr:hypothetical protein [Acidobacteriota bacterium]
MPLRTLVLLLMVAATAPLRAAAGLDWSGFALLRGGTANEAIPLEDDQISTQVQVGLDWRPSLMLGGHVHLLARNDADGSRRGRVGIVEAWLEQSFVRGPNRVRLMEGAFFLPTSRENVDALWESPFTITSSALNSWFGEELRPVGIDAAYTRRQVLGGAATGAVTLFTGNDTFGSLPVDRGWALTDRWSLLGEHVRVDEEYFTSISAETDHRLGWAARGRWNNDRATVQLTHIDNRGDALEHGELLNWDTQFDVAGADLTLGDWTFAAESGWGVTTVIFEGIRYPTDIRASYVLVSRRFASARASLRAEAFQNGIEHDHAITAAFFWSPRGKVRAGIEAIASGGDKRLAAEVRYHFGK